MPRSRRPNLTKVKSQAYQPLEKNGISLRDDELLDEYFKPLKIGGKVAPIELSANKARFAGNLLINKVEGDINIADGDVNLNQGAKVRFDNNITTEVSAVTSGNSYINVEDDVMYFYVGGEKLLTIGQEFGLGAIDKITTFTSDLSIDEGQKLYFEGMSSDSYLHRTTGDIYELYGDGTKLVSIYDAGTVVLHAGDLTFENGETISNSTDGVLAFDGHINMTAAKRLRFDGDHTYITESSNDILDIYVGGDRALVLDEVTSTIRLTEGWSLCFDIDSAHTCIEEISNDRLVVKVGGDIMLDLEEKGDDGNEVSFGSSCVGFTQLEPTYDATATLVDFRHSNKQFVTFGAGNITNMSLIFPLVSGNFVLLIKQDGTGSRTITNYKAIEFDESSADGDAAVKFAGGSNPTLTTDANHVDIISFYWDADNEIAYGVATLDFQF